MALPSLSIRFRIFGGSALLVAFSLMLAGLGVWELTSIDGHVGRLVGLADASNHSLEISQLIERTGRLALHYKATGNPASMEGSAKAQAAALAMLRDAERATPSEQRRLSYQTLERGITNYQAMWANGLVLTKQVRDARPGLLHADDELSAAVNATLTALHALDDPNVDRAADPLATSILALRVASFRFLSAPGAEGAAAFKTDLANSRAALEALGPLNLSPSTQLLVGKAKQTLDAYAAAFEAVSGLIIKTNELFDQHMRPLVEDLVAQIANAQMSLRQDFADTEKNVTSSIGATISAQKVVGLVALLLGSGLALLLGRGVIRPVAGMTVAMQQLAAGDTTVEIPSKESRDEIGSMAKAVEVFRQNALDRIRLETERAEQERRAAQEKRTSMLSLADGFERSVGGIVAEVAGASAEMEKTARSMAAMAERASAQAGTVASAATEATGNVQMVASATEELRASINEINQRVVLSTQMALQAVADAKQTDDTVTGLSEGARKIGDVVSLIGTIASQTNLLALNATIEAARAGDAGKGFAVVASEVKNLAGQTAKATQDIAAQIAAIQSATAGAVTAIQGIGTQIAQMNEVSTSIAAAIEQQGAATRAIAGSVDEATRGTESVSTNIAGVNDASSEVGAAASEVLRAASGMSLGSARMKAEVAGFLATLRAA